MYDGGSVSTCSCLLLLRGFVYPDDIILLIIWATNLSIGVEKQASSYK